MARPARRRARAKPGALLADGFEVAGRTTRAAIAPVLLLAALLWGLRAWGPGHVVDWGRGREALVTVPLALLLVPLMGLAMRRLADAGWRGAWALLLLVPYARAAVALVLLLAPPSQRRRAASTGLRLGALGLAGCAALVLLASLLWTLVPVAGGGMKPALLPGDLALVRRAPVEARRGDVLAFAVPGEARPQLARVIGLPGETVAVEGGVPVIDGVPAAATPDGWWTETFGRQGPDGIMPVCGNGTVGLGAACTTRRLIETLPGAGPHAILDTGPRPLDAMPAVTVAPRTLFVLSDHRDAGPDSRRAPGAQGTGLVPEAAVIGRVDRVLVSAGGRSPLDPRAWRWGRVLEGVE